MAKSAKRASGARLTINVKNPKLLQAAVARMQNATKAALQKALTPNVDDDARAVIAGSISPGAQYKLYSTPRKIGVGEPEYLAFSGSYDDVLTKYTEVVAQGVNPDRSYVMSDPRDKPVCAS